MQNKTYLKAILYFFIVLLFLIVAYFSYIFYAQRQAEKALVREQIVDETITTLEELNRQGLYEDVITVAQQYRQSNRYNLVAMYLLEAAAYLQQGSILYEEEKYADKAIAVLNMAQAIDTSNSEVHRLLGYAYEIKQDYVVAEQHYTQAITLHPDSTEAYAGRGHMYYLAGDEAAALSDITKALDLDPYNAKALLDLSLYHMRNGTDLTTVPIAEMLYQAIELTDEKAIQAEIYATLGSYYYHHVRNIQDAEQSYTFALSVQPKSVMAHIGLVFVYVDLMSQSTSEQQFFVYAQKVNDHLEQAAAVQENNARIYIAQGYYYAHVGDAEREREAYITAFDMVDADITLSVAQKVELKDYINSLLRTI